MPKLRLGLIQMPVGNPPQRNLEIAMEMGAQALKSKADLICFPEYFGFPPRLIPIQTGLELSSEIRELLKELSQDGTCLGNALEELGNQIFNCGYLFSHGELVGKQYKLHPTQGERAWGISPGTQLNCFQLDGIRIGILICADILYPEAPRILGLKSADLVLNPVISIQRSPDPLRQSRIWMYVARSLDNGFYIAKVGGVGRGIFGDLVVGRSLVAAPWGIIAQSKDESSPQIIYVDLDFAELARIRQLHCSLELRNPQAYLELVRSQASSAAPDIS